MNTLDDHVVVASAKTPHRRFSAVAAFFDVPNQDSQYWLADSNGGGVELPAELWGLLRDAAAALAGECGVTLKSVPATLGLQEAAELAAIPLPTLLQCVSDGSIPLSESLVGIDDTDTVALRDVVRLREYLNRQCRASERSLAIEASIPPALPRADENSWSPTREASPVSAWPSYPEPNVSASLISASYPEPTIGPSPISASPAAPSYPSPVPVSPAWSELEYSGYGAAPVSPVTGPNSSRTQSPGRVRAVARVASVAPSRVSPPISAPATQWAASWVDNDSRPSSPMPAVPAGSAGTELVAAGAAPSPVSVPRTWYSTSRH
ncbi:MAG: hypothetical protein DLM55_00565 [Acidimicrobiales bacterium]|nr:MAG: hypothetical protein DLM55_00565 [Acidimicrobiales bacterium]